MENFRQYFLYFSQIPQKSVALPDPGQKRLTGEMNLYVVVTKYPNTSSEWYQRSPSRQLGFLPSWLVVRLLSHLHTLCQWGAWTSIPTQQQ